MLGVPGRADGFGLATDDHFVEKFYDVVGPYLNLPEAAVVLSVHAVFYRSRLLSRVL